MVPQLGQCGSLWPHLQGERLGQHCGHGVMTAVVQALGLEQRQEVQSKGAEQKGVPEGGQPQRQTVWWLLQHQTHHQVLERGLRPWTAVRIYSGE